MAVKRGDGRRNPWVRSRRVERTYERSLRGVAREIGRVFAGFGVRADKVPDTATMAALTDHLRRYADVIAPFAEAVAERMVTDASAQDLATWRSNSADLRTGLIREIADAPTGLVTRDLIAGNVGLITSLPREAAERAQALALRAVTDGTRASETAKMIAASGEVSLSRSTLIARTETSRAGTMLTQARAQYIGSDSYYWRTSRDSDTRPSHAKMEGREVRWNLPPTLDGLTGHPGCIPNCRCWAEPRIEDLD